jgi:hypothetical protein
MSPDYSGMAAIGDQMLIPETHAAKAFFCTKKWNPASSHRLYTKPTGQQSKTGPIGIFC